MWTPYSIQAMALSKLLAASVSAVELEAEKAEKKWITIVRDVPK
jgi:hypothetical protein